MTLNPDREGKTDAKKMTTENGGLNRVEEKKSAVPVFRNTPPFKRREKELLASPLAFFYDFMTLKQRFRRGWLQRGVSPEKCESVADHSFGIALLAMLTVDTMPGVDKSKAVMMALTHELGEILAGDITPADRMSEAEKTEMEHQAVEKITDEYPEAADPAALWYEFEEGATPEAKFVRQLDKLEMALQALYYESVCDASVESFFVNIVPLFKEKELFSLFDSVRKARSSSTDGTE